jgi:hypothetical protein
MFDALQWVEQIRSDLKPLEKQILGHSYVKALEEGRDTLKRMTCPHCFYEYQQSIQEMVLRPKTQAEIDAVGGESALTWI